MQSAPGILAGSTVHPFFTRPVFDPAHAGQPGGALLRRLGPRITFTVAYVEPMTQVQLDMVSPLYGPLGITMSDS